jgi:general L-amino acid transport system permease protein
MASIDTAPRAPQRSFSLNDPFFRGIVYQAVTALIVVSSIVWIINNTAANLKAQNKTSGFDFLWKTSGFDISFSLFPFDRASFYWEAFLVGLTNTILVAAIGIVFATLIGFTIGIARLSSNYLISRLATVYVETLRNIPLLLQLFFWYFAVLKTMPAVRDSHRAAARHLHQPARPVRSPGRSSTISSPSSGVALSWASRPGSPSPAGRSARLEATGKRFPVCWTSVAYPLSASPAIGWLAVGAQPSAFDRPVAQPLQLQGRPRPAAGTVALIMGLTHLYRDLHRRERPRRHPGGQPRPDRGRPVARAQGRRPAPAGDRSAGHARDHPAAHQPISQPHQELLARRRHRLPRTGVDLFTGTTLNQAGRAIESSR